MYNHAKFGKLVSCIIYDMIYYSWLTKCLQRYFTFILLTILSVVLRFYEWNHVDRIYNLLGMKRAMSLEQSEGEESGILEGGKALEKNI